MKIKKHGKNKAAFKKLMAEVETTVTLNGKNAKSLFESLIGYEFMCNIVEKGLEVVGLDGEAFIINTNQKIEIV